MVLPRIANPFRAFLGRCRFESGLFRHHGSRSQHKYGVIALLLEEGWPAGRAQSTRNSGGFAVKCTPVLFRGNAVKPPNDRLAQMARTVVSRVQVPDGSPMYLKMEFSIFCTIYADVAKLADALDLGSSG